MIGIQGETTLDEVTKSPADAALSTTSTNSVQNKVVTKEINEINNDLANLDNVSRIETLSGSVSKYLANVPKKLIVKIGDAGAQYQINHLIYTDTLIANRKEYIYVGNGYLMATFVINITTGEVYIDKLEVNGVDKTSTAQAVLYSVN